MPTITNAPHLGDPWNSVVLPESEDSRHICLLGISAGVWEMQQEFERRQRELPLSPFEIIRHI
ncbi:MAG: hypothetical protein AAF988_01010 [Pseudomonadota bacterium]